MARILVVDDDQNLRTMLVETLAASGHEVRFAGNGFDVAVLFRKEPTDLILSDINMPYGGRQTIRVLRAECPQQAIIAMSGNRPQLSMAGAIGANRILSKPFTFPQLARAIAEVLGPAVAPPAARA